MASRVISDTKKPIKMWLNDIEPAAEEQLRRLGNLPFIYKHVAVMPDAHHGRGSTVGTVIATKGAIIPAAVGVDIGCGMYAVRLPFRVDALERIDELRSSIERSIPVGFRQNRNVSDATGKRFMSLGQTERTKTSLSGNALSQLGSLGGGNHFIELCMDGDGYVWVMLHSGSRNVGKRLADYHISRAKDLMLRYFIDLPDPDLSYFVQGTEQFKEYIEDLLWAQNYAMENRHEMMLRVLKDISYHVYGEMRDDLRTLEVHCHHNYTAMEHHFGHNIWVTRKGAVSARAGERGIIPGSMGTRSYIVEGLGNEESFCSCSHGAGRRMSRTEAKRRFTIEDVLEQTSGVSCRKDEGIIDELPSAYKDIDEVMQNQKDLVRPIFELKQFLCIKG